MKPFIGEGFGGPDGMTIDENGDLWVAVFGTGTILNVNGNSGKLIRKVNLPLLQVTSVAFGGKDLDELYVTSGAFKLSEQDKQRYPLSGCTLKITGLGVKGRRAAPADF